MNAAPVIHAKQGIVFPQKLYNGLDLINPVQQEGELKECFIIQIRQEKKPLTQSLSISSRDSRKAVGSG
jgi:hypothetical protein